ncbi:MAG: alpha/beta fold hydrolase [Nanoarchaeota archaeon]
MEQNVELITTDGISIAASYFKGESTKGIIFLHQLASSKESWNKLINELTEYHMIAIDLRGHGASDLEWGSFNDKDFNNMINDIEAAEKYLKEKKVTEIGIIGASIGANLAIKYGVDHNLKTVVALSPGLNYRGIDIDENSAMLNIPTLIVVGDGDGYSTETSSTIYGSIPNEEKELLELHNKLHGVNMLDKALINKIKEWLKKYL